MMAVAFTYGDPTPKPHSLTLNEILARLMIKNARHQEQGEPWDEKDLDEALQAITALHDAQIEYVIGEKINPKLVLEKSAHENIIAGYNQALDDIRQRYKELKGE